MPRRRDDYYDPIIQTDAPTEEPPGAELPLLHGMIVEFPGTYIAAADVSATLAQYALEWTGEAREALYEMARYFASTEGTRAADGQPGPPGGITWSEPEPAIPDEGVNSVDTEPIADRYPEIALVEVYPDVDPDGTVTYWNARPVNFGGMVLPGGFGNINHDSLIATVEGSWPGKLIQVGPDARFDALWEREHASSRFNGRRAPSPRRLFG